MKKVEQVGIRQATAKGYTECDIGGVADFLYPTSLSRRGRVQGQGQICPAVTSDNFGVCKVEKNMEFKDGVIYPDEDITQKESKEDEVDWENCEYRIRKLTSRECGRLMDVEEKDIDTILNTNSNTQAYRQFGNSIVVSVLCAIFSQLNIQGIKPWNERTLEEKKELISR